MTRGEKGGEGPAEKEENLGEKLKRGAVVVGQRGGQSTPVLPFWRLQPPFPAQGSGSSPVPGVQDSIFIEGEAFPSVSARKLAATLWEFDSYKLPLSRMHQGVSGTPLRQVRRHQNHHNHHKQQQMGKDKDLDLPEPSTCSADLGTTCSLRRQVAASLMQHHRSIQRNHHAIQLVSPASYGSSMEVAPYNPVITSTSSTDFRGGIGETSSTLKTSTELLKVLNRIWSLEEQHASNISLVRAMKKELDQARVRMKEMARAQQADRHEMDKLMTQIAEDRLARKSKEQDRVSAVIQSVRDELEDERKLRKRSETLHRKLARELYEVKTSLANAVKNVEVERKSRILLEELCDEFAWEIKNSEQELHALKQQSGKDWTNRGDRDGLILHLSESWLDERMQMKQEAQFGLGEKNSVVDKLSVEIHNLLQAKQNGDRASRVLAGRRNSLESIPIKVAASAPQQRGDEDGSSESCDSHCFELDKPLTIDLKPEGGEFAGGFVDAITKSNHEMKNPMSKDRTKARNLGSMQVKDEEQMGRAMSGNERKNRDEEKNVRKAGEEKEIIEETEQGGLEGKKTNETRGLNLNSIDSLLRNHHLLSESGILPSENNCGDFHGNSVWRSHPSPVRQWTTRLPTQELDISESSSKLPPDLKENTLKAKLLEARTRGQNQRTRSRLKPSKVS